MTTAFDFETTAIDGKPFSLSALKGHVLLIVNTASACGFTPQLTGLQALYQRYSAQGLVVLGFPCNQFGGQDPRPNEQIAQFCSLDHGVTFPMMAKVDVNGEAAEPLFKWLKAQAPGVLGTEMIKWNFTKFLVGRDGHVRQRYAPTDKPESLAEDIEKALIS